VPLRSRIQVKTTKKPVKVIKTRYNKEFKKTLREVGEKGVENIKNEIKKRDLIDSGEMYGSVKYELTAKGVKFIVSEPAPYLEKGIKPHQMRYLLKSKSPIPVNVMNSEFRWASEKGMRQGKWMHPGFKGGVGFMKSAIKRTKEDLGKKLKEVASKTFK